MKRSETRFKRKPRVPLSYYAPTVVPKHCSSHLSCGLQKRVQETATSHRSREIIIVN